MPTYQVTSPDGRQVRLTGDSPPTEAELEDVFKSLPAKTAGPTQSQNPGYFQGAEGISATPWHSQGMFMGHGPSVRDVLGTLPTVGGAIGGVAGAPGVGTALIGAALGGGGGEALKQLGERAIGVQTPQTGTEAATSIGKEAAIQAAAELGGRGIAGVGKAVGKGMVENAVRPSITLRREFPDVLDTIVRERLPVGAAPFGTVKGSERAALRLAEESKAVKALLGKATAGGKNFETSKLAEPVLKLLDDIAEQPLAKADMVSLEKMFDEFTAKKGPLSPLDVQKLKQSAQAIAKPIYKAVARGENVSADQAIKARFNSAIATGAKQAMETVPGVAAGEAKKRSLIGAQRALSQAEMRRLSLMGEMLPATAGVVSSMLGSGSGMDENLRRGAIAYAAIRFGMSPRSLSRGGLVLTSAQAQELMRQFPRLGLAVASSLGQGAAEQPTTGPR